MLNLTQWDIEGRLAGEPSTASTGVGPPRFRCSDGCRWAFYSVEGVCEHRAVCRWYQVFGARYGALDREGSYWLVCDGCGAGYGGPHYRDCPGATYTRRAEGV